jgi:DNA-binding PadR family transcriptional regulator
MTATRSYIGEFEQVVLLAVLRCGGQAFGLDVRREIEASTGRDVSRGAFYTTLDRLEAKGLVEWTPDPAVRGRGGLPQRRFRVTAAGVRELRATRQALLTLWQGLDHVLEP